jgi:hypothetical protein
MNATKKVPYMKILPQSHFMANIKILSSTPQHESAEFSTSEKHKMFISPKDTPSVLGKWVGTGHDNKRIPALLEIHLIVTLSLYYFGSIHFQCLG